MKDELVEAFGKLPTAVVADVFRYMQYPQQVMDSSILPVLDGWKLCGRAFTMANLPRRKHEVSLFREAESHWGEGQVVVESYWGAWGINFAIGAHVKGCVGAVIDGSYRDIPEHKHVLPDFPVFCRRGLSERSSNPGGSHRSFQTRWMYAYQVPINCAGVRVEPNDIILGDDDGVVVVPQDIAPVVLQFCLSYEEADGAAGKGLLAGQDPKEAYAMHDRWPRDSGLLEWVINDHPGARKA